MAMSVTVNELFDKLGIGRVPGPYETCPWSVYKPETGTTCSAEVRMGPDNDEVEGEIQMVYDMPPEGKGPMDQVCYLRANARAGQWAVNILRIRGEPYGKDIHNWEEKSCVFFALVVQALQRDELPDIDDLLGEAFHGRERLADQRGGGGGKSPKIRPAQLLDMKKGRGF